MALIKCTECGREISDKSKACIHCGCPIELEELNNCDEVMNVIEGTPLLTQKKETLQFINLLKNKKIVIPLVALVVLVFSIFIFVTNSLSPEEEYRLKIVEKYQDMLKNPDSLVLRSDIAVISYSRNGNTYEYVFFDASGDNSYGTSVTSTPCFVDGQYLCDTDEIPTTS